MASISLLPDEILLYICEYLETQDRIVFAYASSRFRQIYQNNPRMMRKVDLSRHVVRKEQDAVNQFFQDKQMLQHIRELNLNNNHVRNWQLDDNMEQFIMGICPHLEALHVLNCGISLEILHRITQRAPKLTALSFSILDLSGKDIQIISGNNVCLENIRKLRIEIAPFSEHIRILKYLLLSRCKWLEELEIFIWILRELEFSRIKTCCGYLDLASEELMEPLKHLHSLTVKAETSYNGSFWDSIELDLYYFIHFVAKIKLRQANWKRFWVSIPLKSQLLFHLPAVNWLNSVEAFATNSDVKSLVGTINNTVVRKLQLQRVKFFDEYLDSIASIGGEALQSLSLYDILEFSSPGLDAKLVFNTLFSACANIREIRLYACHFPTNICESLSKLKHLMRLEIHVCGIAANSNAELNEANAKLLNMVECCPHVLEFYLHYCTNQTCKVSRFVVDDDLLPIAKWTKLESFTCDCFSFCIEQGKQATVTGTFLRNVVEACHFLTTLKISIEDYEETAHFTFLKSAKFLKHLAIDTHDVDLGLEDIWLLISYATNLERLCMTSSYEGSVNIPAVVKMLKGLPGLHVFHLHYLFIRNLATFQRYITNTLKETHSSSFEFLIEKDGSYWSYKKVLPVNISELCYKTSGMVLEGV